SCPQQFYKSYHWLGVFSFSNLEMKLISHEHNLIACSDVVFNMEMISKDADHSWKWSAMNELSFEGGLEKDLAEEDGEIYVMPHKMKNVFSFGDGIFFLITHKNQIYFTTDSRVFRRCPLNDWLKSADFITSIALYGSVLACASFHGYVFVHSFTAPEHLHYLTHHKPLVNRRVTTDQIISVAITDNGLDLMVGVATKTTLYTLNCSPKAKLLDTCSSSPSPSPSPVSPEVIDISSSSSVRSSDVEVIDIED
ncbi:unnamed protein product, partial [Oppiella nova]